MEGSPKGNHGHESFAKTQYTLIILGPIQKARSISEKIPPRLSVLEASSSNRRNFGGEIRARFGEVQSHR
jgi:hypothetical protein